MCHKSLSVVAFFLLMDLTVSQSQQEVDLCDYSENNNQNLTEYPYKNVSSQNCDCPNSARCVRKCCAVGFYTVKGFCKKYTSTGDNNSSSNVNFSVPVFTGTNFVQNLTLIDSGFLAGVMKCEFFPFYNSGSDWFFLQEDGKLLTSNYGLVDNEHFCLDYLHGDELVAFVCYLNESDLPRKVNAMGMIISMPFLLATFIVYAVLPDRNLHMKALMSYVINLMFSYLLLVINQLSQAQIAAGACTFLGYATLFFFMVSFFWMNVICFDIWFTFSGLRGHVNGRQAERRRFLIYCCYAWGMSILHVVVVFVIDKVSSSTAWYSPSIGNAQCFLQRGYAELFYFYGPMALLIAINVILFGITAFKIWSIKKDTAVLRKDENSKHSQENDKQTFILYLKLLFAMGVNWTMEITSWAVNWGAEAGSISPVVWYLTDFCNAMYGVLIFFIFVFKRSIWKLLKRRYFSFMGRSHMAHSMSQNPTRTTNYSTTGTGLSGASEA